MVKHVLHDINESCNQKLLQFHLTFTEILFSTYNFEEKNTETASKPYGYTLRKQ